MTTSDFALLTSEFYARPTVEVARDLLGAVLYRRFEDGTVACATIAEVEAYTQDDPACHAFKGITERCRVMFGPPGYAYVYFIYGRYNCLNVVTEPEGNGAAVLIRALAMPGGSGPGKLCETWRIDRALNGVSLVSGQTPLWIAAGEHVKSKDMGSSQRIGITSAQDKIWRFYIRNNPYISGPRRLGGGAKPMSRARKGAQK